MFVACRFWWPDQFCQVILRRHSELCPLLAKVALVRVRADVCVCVCGSDGSQGVLSLDV